MSEQQILLLSNAEVSDRSVEDLKHLQANKSSIAFRQPVNARSERENYLRK